LPLTAISQEALDLLSTKDEGLALPDIRAGGIRPLTVNCSLDRALRGGLDLASLGQGDEIQADALHVSDTEK
jgi:hypothetical protein